MDDSNNSSKPHNEKATQAYKLFSQGKRPFEVAIELGIRYLKQKYIMYHQMWAKKLGVEVAVAVA